MFHAKFNGHNNFLYKNKFLCFFDVISKILINFIQFNLKLNLSTKTKILFI